MTQYKLLILKTSRQFPGKDWLYYDIAFHKDAAASGLVDWSHMNLDLYNFHTCTTLLQTSPFSDVLSSSSRMLASSSNICWSWKDGTCRWPFGQCRYHHCCEKCEGEQPCVSCPFQASQSNSQHSRSATLPQSKRLVARSFQPTLRKYFVHK